MQTNNNQTLTKLNNETVKLNRIIHDQIAIQANNQNIDAIKQSHPSKTDK